MITNAYKGTLYLGHTDNLAQRMDQHRHGLLPGFSKKYGLRHLVWYRAFETRDAAFKCERQMKEWKRDWKLKRINDMNPDWIDLSTVPVWPLPDPTRRFFGSF